MPYLDGLPVASSVSPSDIVAVDQGGTPGVPGSAITRQATVALLLAGGSGFLPISGGTITGTLTVDGTTTLEAHLVLVNIPTDPTGLATGTVYSDGGVLCIA